MQIVFHGIWKIFSFFFWCILTYLISMYAEINRNNKFHFLAVITQKPIHFWSHKIEKTDFAFSFSKLKKKKKIPNKNYYDFVQLMIYCKIGN